MPIQVFIDESGSLNSTKLFVMAGVFSDASSWLEFSIEWRRCLDRQPSIRTFKMKEAARLTGQFRKFTAQQRDQKLTELLRIINRYVRCVIFAAYDLDVRARLAPPDSKILRSPYEFAFQTVVWGSCFELWDVGLRDRFEVVFDEELILGPRARRIYPVIVEVLREQYPGEAQIMPTDPLFRKDDNFLPLQAADLYAYCFRRFNENQEDKSFEWMLKETRNVELSKHSHFYDEDRTRYMLDLSFELDEDDLVNRFNRAYRKVHEQTD